jgi:hypothetical protein
VRTPRLIFAYWFVGALASLAMPLACGSGGGSAFNPGHDPADLIPGFGDASLGGDGPGGGPFGNDGNAPHCTSGGQCVHACASGVQTTIRGTVYDPAMKNPLYGVVVYVPSQPVAPISTGASCYTCSSLYTGDPVAFAVTDSVGNFTIQGAPDGANIPLVVQVGKWRKQFTVPSVAQCSGTAIPDKTLSLPANHDPTDPRGGDIPSIAIATGGADTLECLLRRIGVDAAEYGPGAGGDGRIHIFVGDKGADTSAPAPNAYDALWNTKADLMAFDLVLLTCEGHPTTSDGTNPLTTTMQQALYDYAANGGRAFASHYHYAWFNTGPFAAQNLAQWATGGQDYTAPLIYANIETTLPAGGAFPRGAAMKQWLGNVGALTNGELPIEIARHNALVTAANTASIPWIVADQDASPPNETEYFSFDTPFGVNPDQQCGRVVYSDLHVGAASKDYHWNGTSVPSGAIVPSGCADADLSPQEKALEFMLFDLSACITPPGQGAGGVPPR